MEQKDQFIESAQDLILTKLDNQVEHVSAMRVSDDENGNPIVAVTVKVLSQALIYEVWEVCFISSGPHGMFGKVAHPGNMEFDYKEFSWKAEYYVPGSILIGEERITFEEATPQGIADVVRQMNEHLEP